MELIMKRRELLKMNEIEAENDDDDADTGTSREQEDAILSCKIVEIVFKNALKQFKGFKSNIFLPQFNIQYCHTGLV